MTTRRVGSLCSGYGGLDAAVCKKFDGELAWVADDARVPYLVLSSNDPGVPNLGDIRTIRWDDVEPVDIVTAGFPCQDVSAAGLMVGLHPGNRSGVWLYVAEAIGKLRPSLVVLENVKGLLSARAHSSVEPCEICLGDPAAGSMRALGAVLGDLSGLGFDAEWETVSAADVGSCHLRERVFILAWPSGTSPASHSAGSGRYGRSPLPLRRAS